MSTRMTINGVSTCTEAGTEKYEKFRHTDGELFSCVKPTLEECRATRDKWLTAKEGKEGKQ